MIISKNHTALSYNPTNNVIMISLPQTPTTANTSVYPPVKRLVDVPEAKLYVLIQIVELLFAYGENVDGGNE